MAASVALLFLAPWTTLPAVLFFGAALALGVLYTMEMHRRTGRSWWRGFAWDALGDAAQLWRYVYSPSGIRRSVSVLRGPRLKT